VHGAFGRKARGGGEAVTSSTTSNAAIAVQPPRGRAAARTRIPWGFGRRGGICVAPPCICPGGAQFSDSFLVHRIWFCDLPGATGQFKLRIEKK
jgi:hypothetical protein